MSPIKLSIWISGFAERLFASGRKTNHETPKPGKQEASENSRAIRSSFAQTRRFKTEVKYHSEESQRANEHPDDVSLALDTNEAFRITVTHRPARMLLFSRESGDSSSVDYGRPKMKDGTGAA
jgi:hypothetical protein